MYKLNRHPMFLMDAASEAAAAAAAQAAAAGGGTNGNGTGANAGKTYTQEQLDTMFGERAKQAKSAAESALLAELGVPDLAAAKDKLKKAADAEAAGLTALEKAQKEAADAKADADSARAEAETARTRASESLARSAVNAAALAANIDPAELTTLWLALRADKALWARVKPKADSDGEFDGVEDVVKEMLKAHPRWVATNVVKHDINAGERGAPSEAALKAASEAQGRQSRNRF